MNPEDSISSPPAKQIVPAQPSIGQLASALAKAQGAFAPILRTREVTVRSDKGNYSFAYAPLENVLAAVTPALAANGLSLVTRQDDDGTRVRVRTVLQHSSGQEIDSTLVVPSMAAVGPQKYGSALTYARRYAVSALLGVASEEDDDANVAEGNHVAERRDHVQKPGPLSELWDAVTSLLKSESPADVLDWCSAMLGRTIANRNDMTASEIKALTEKARNGEVPKGGTKSSHGERAEASGSISGGRAA